MDREAAKAHGRRWAASIGSHDNCVGPDEDVDPYYGLCGEPHGGQQAILCGRSTGHTGEHRNRLLAWPQKERTVELEDDMGTEYAVIGDESYFELGKGEWWRLVADEERGRMRAGDARGGLLLERLPKAEFVHAVVKTWCESNRERFDPGHFEWIADVGGRLWGFMEVYDWRATLVDDRGDDYVTDGLALAGSRYRQDVVPEQQGFNECATCAAKPGAPTLCTQCLARRAMAGVDDALGGDGLGGALEAFSKAAYDNLDEGESWAMQWDAMSARERSDWTVPVEATLRLLGYTGGASNVPHEVIHPDLVERANLYREELGLLELSPSADEVKSDLPQPGEVWSVWSDRGWPKEAQVIAVEGSAIRVRWRDPLEPQMLCARPMAWALRRLKGAP